MKTKSPRCCKICNRAFETKTKRATCSPECLAELNRRKSRAYDAEFPQLTFACPCGNSFRSRLRGKVKCPQCDGTQKLSRKVTNHAPRIPVATQPQSVPPKTIRPVPGGYAERMQALRF